MASRLRRWLEPDIAPAQAEPGRLHPMEGLRGLAVVLVFAQHYAMQSILFIDLQGAASAMAGWARNFGSLGVELFFILSGFLIYGTLLGRQPGFLPFMARRVERLYPAFLCVFIPVAALHLALATGEIPPEPGRAVLVVLSNLLLLPGVLASEPVLRVAWTLSWEMFFYLALGLLVPGLALHRRPRRMRVGLILAVAASVAALAEAAPDGLGPFAVPLPLLPFLAGMLLFEAREAGAWSVPGWAALPAGALSLTVGPFVGLTVMLHQALETLALALLCSAAFQGGNITARALCWRPLRWLGNISYSFYLVHGLVVVAIFRGLGWAFGAGWPSSGFWLLAPPLFAAGVAASLVLFVLVERPFSLKPRLTPTANVD